MKILIVGANGLLGRCLWHELQGSASSPSAVAGDAHSVVGTYRSRPEEGLVPLNADDREAVRRLLGEGQFDAVVNCAAQRDPDTCLRDPLGAYRDNAVAVEILAAASEEIGALFCQISTDYVFSGTKPPYREEDPPDPINLYGRSKLAGEWAARVAKKHLIVRIPALYRTDLTDPRNIATTFAKSPKPLGPLDSVTVRYYTLADDVARALRFLLEQKIQGIIHLTAHQKTSKADFARRVMVALGRGPEWVEDGPIPTTGDLRPLDSHLSDGRYRSLGGPSFTSIDEALCRIKGFRS